MTKVICMYLPQFHEFAENNEWWGKGFTEWTCVDRAVEICPGHRIKKPHPDIGRYDLRNPETRRLQALMAKDHGVYGFCYYHYWFNGKILMEEPLHLMLQDGEPDLPFMMSWANEPWTRRMNGGNGETIQPQSYGGEEEWKSHLNYLMQFFRHKNYIKIDGKPALVIYRVSQINRHKDRFDYWRKEILKYFPGMFIISTIGPFPKSEVTDTSCSVDAVFDFYPNFLRSPETVSCEIGSVAVCDIEKAWSIMLQDKNVLPTHFKGMMVGFDSSPRNPQRSCAFINNTPSGFLAAMRKQMYRAYGDEFIFVNGWNEWGEQACLEPDEKDGYAYLNAIKKATTHRVYHD